MLLVSLSIACALHYSELSLPYYSENIPLGLSAYSFGYLTREYLYKPSVFFLALCCYMGILILFPSSISFRENEVIGDGSYMLAIVFSLAGCIVINNVFKRFVPHRCPVLYWIGCRTMDFYVPHMIVLTLCLFSPRVCVSWLKEIQCLMCIIILPLFSVCVNRYGLGWIFGKAKTMHV